MERSKNKLQINNERINMDIIQSKTDVNINEVKNFTDEIHKEKQKLLNNSFEKVKSLSNDLDNLKLQNEELEVIIQNLTKEKDNLENSYELLNKSFTILSKKYNETRELLNTSHNQNLLLSEVIEKLRYNEKCLIEESQKLRRVGSSGGEFNDLHLNIKTGTIENLQKEVKFWQQEAEKLYQIIDLQDKTTAKFINNKSSDLKSSKKKIPSGNKRYNKVVVRSHSVENAQKKIKEHEFLKMKMEKEKMQSLLNNLEYQITEIQNNIVKISNEKMKYKELYFEKKENGEKSNILISEFEKLLDEKMKENLNFKTENEKYSENINILINDNKHYQFSNQNLLMEINEIKNQNCIEIKNAELKIKGLVNENHDLGIRSTNLKDKLQTMELELSKFEQDIINKNQQLKEQESFIENLKSQLENIHKELKERSEQLICMEDKLKENHEENRKLKNHIELIENKFELKIKDLNSLKHQVKEKEDDINKKKTSMAAQKIKFENHLQNADQIISTKLKLISSLELRLANIDQDNKLKDDEILHLKKSINTQIHDYDVSINKYEESQNANKYLQQHIDHISVTNNDNSREIIALHQSVTDLSNIIEKLKRESKNQKEILNKKDEEIFKIDNNKKELEKELIVNVEEINKNKKVISQLCNEIEQKAAHVESVLDVLQEKEEIISMKQLTIEDKENTIKDYATQLNSYDESIIHSTARTSALEKEIEALKNSNSRLSRQKEQLSCSLSERNKELGHLQARIDNLDANGIRRKHLSHHESIERENTNQDFQIVPKNIHEIHRKIPIMDNEGKNNIKLSDNSRFSIHKNTISDNYDPVALKNRSYSYDGRDLHSIDCI